jgi:hypothetical protein
MDNILAYQQGRLQPLLWTTTATMTAVKGNVAEAPSQSPSQPPPSETLTSDTLREPVLQRETTTSVTSNSETNLMIQKVSPVYDYDLVVIGGGSGGLACVREGKIAYEISSIYRDFFLQFIFILYPYIYIYI